jgi:hypothetical protein
VIVEMRSSRSAFEVTRPIPSKTVVASSWKPVPSAFSE